MSAIRRYGDPTLPHPGASDFLAFPGALVSDQLHLPLSYTVNYHRRQQDACKNTNAVVSPTGVQDTEGVSEALPPPVTLLSAFCKRNSEAQSFQRRTVERSASISSKREFALQKWTRNPEIDVAYLQLTKLIQCFKPRVYAVEILAWIDYEWFLTNEDIEFLKITNYLNFPYEIVPPFNNNFYFYHLF
ncbi:hypothetical protein L6164_026125 [Bauhinia variegata]|uniref:Uncharacterized protein n=1 Tax=Bauhinia variegata TaxID=167791 RepID=A0ACB9LPP3_BAUVA|nr:hypothetical protein L6164_026125 [Bauhinia variegata]